jgi:catechol 2,3-dioxygenase-like lactoylglutathione lyase family enzyme
MRPISLDHVAFWVADREPIVERCERYLGMHVIDEEDEFTLVGRDARRGKLTFFDADGPRERAPLCHVALRVADLEGAQRLLPASPDVLELGEGVRIRLVQGPAGADYDLDHVALSSSDPEDTARRFERYGFTRVSPTAVEVGDSRLVFERGEAAEGDRPLLNHLGLLVESAEEHRTEADELGLEVESFVDAPNTLAVFVTGPEGIRVEYVEHKPTFTLA